MGRSVAALGAIDRQRRFGGVAAADLRATAGLRRIRFRKTHIIRTAVLHCLGELPISIVWTLTVLYFPSAFVLTESAQITRVVNRWHRTQSHELNAAI